MIKQASKNPRSSAFQQDTADGIYRLFYTVNQPLYAPQCALMENYLRQRISTRLNDRLISVGQDDYGSFVLKFTDDLYPGKRLEEHLWEIISESPFMQEACYSQLLQNSLYEVLAAWRQQALTQDQAQAVASIILPELLTQDHLMDYSVNFGQARELFTASQALGLAVQWKNAAPDRSDELLNTDELEQWMALGDYQALMADVRSRWGAKWPNSAAVLHWAEDGDNSLEDLAEILAAEPAV